MAFAASLSCRLGWVDQSVGWDVSRLDIGVVSAYSAGSPLAAIGALCALLGACGAVSFCGAPAAFRGAGRGRRTALWAASQALADIGYG